MEVLSVVAFIGYCAKENRIIGLNDIGFHPECK